MDIVKKLRKDVLLADYSTLRIGGKAKYFFTAYSKEDVIEAVKWACNHNERFFILGGGSNILFSDSGFDGLVIKMDFQGIIKMEDYKTKGVLEANAGCRLSELGEFSRKHSLTGMEWSYGIPGTVGGAIRGNAEAFGESMGRLVQKVEILKLSSKKLEIIFLNQKDCQFGYRTSIFTKKKNQYIILSAEIILLKSDKDKIEEKIAGNMKFRREKQIWTYPNAGSIFKNISCQDENIIKAMQDGCLKRLNKIGNIPVGYLLEKCGLKGKVIGGAMISQKHANIIVNLEGATANDVLILMDLMKKEVKKKFGVNLSNEIEVVL